MFDSTINGGTDAEIVGSVAALLVAITAIVRPWGARAKQRRLEKRTFKIWMNGQPEVKGIFDAVIAAPEQMSNMKHHMEKQDTDIDKVKSGLTALGEKFVQGQKETTKQLKELRELLDTGNGGDTNSPGDISQRRAKREGDWIDEENKP